MKSLSLILPILLVVLLIQSGFSQEMVQPYTAKAYWIELNRPEYRYIKLKQLNNEPLLTSEKKWLQQYEEYLGDYLGFLSSEEKEKFYLQKEEWYAQENIHDIERERIEKPKRNTELLLKHIGYSGLSGMSYGLMLNKIFELNEPASVGLPMVLAGGSMMYPVFSPQYNNINNNSLWLRSHGKIVGGVGGYALGMAIYGNRIDGYYDFTSDSLAGVYIKGHEKEALAMSLVSSLGLGMMGFRLGKQKDWSEGQVSLYQYYGYAIPAFTTSCLYATGYDNLRGYGINILLSVPIGYLAATKISQLADYTRGDVGALVGLSAIGAAYGTSFMLFADAGGEEAILFPALGAAVGSAAGQIILRDTRLSRPEGRRVNYAATGGALIGLGITFFADPGNEGWYLFVPATTSLLGYSLLLRYYRKSQSQDLSLQNDKLSRLNLYFHPENLVYTKINTHGYIPPLVSASMKF